MKITNRTDIRISDTLAVSTDSNENTISIIKVSTGFMSSSVVIVLKPYEMQDIINCVGMLRQTRAGLDFLPPDPAKEKKREINSFADVFNSFHGKNK